VGVVTDSANTIRFDNFNLGPQAKLYGSPITDWIAYTPTITGFGTPTLVNFSYARNGDRLLIEGSFSTGTAAASIASISLPSGLSINSSKIPLSNTTSGPGLSIGSYDQSGFANNHGSIVTATGTSSLVVYFASQTSTTTMLTPQNGSTVLNSSGVTSIRFEVPILGWSSSQVMSSDAATSVIAMQADHPASQALTGSGGVTVISNWSTMFDTNSSFVPSTGYYYAKVPGYYRVSGLLTTSLSTGNYYTRIITASGITQGMFVSVMSLSVSSSTFNAIVMLKAGDYVYVDVINNNASSISTNPYSGNTTLSIERISGPSQIAASESVNCSYENAAGTSIPNATNTALVFATKLYDSHNAFVGSTGIFTCPMSGKYRVTGSLYYGATVATPSDVQLNVYVNGAQVNGVNHPKSGTAPIPLAVNSSFTVNCLAGQTIQLYAYQSTGGALSLLAYSAFNSIMIDRVGN
jgi:hypothetical protein